MTPANFAPNEAARLLALDELNLLDTPADPILDGLVRCAASMLGCPMALVRLIDRNHQRVKASVGLGAMPTDPEPSFCAQAVRGDELFVVTNAAHDPRFAADPLVTGAAHVRFYAGAPLAVDGRIIGTLCVIDRQPRRLDDAQRALLIDLAHAVEHWIVSSREHRQLRETEGFLARIARHVPGAFYQYQLGADGSSRFPYASEGIGAIYELTPEAVRRSASLVFDRLHPDDLASVSVAMQRSARTLTPWLQQYRVLLPERGERWLEGHATPQRLDDGSVLWCGFIQDITERRASEQVIRDNYASERASRAKSEFLSRVSHELRTPLNAVLGFTQLMQADPALPQRTQGHLEQVRRGGELLLELVNDILDLTRIEHGLLALKIGPVDVADVLESSLALLEPLAKLRGIRVMPVQGEASLTARADKRALGQVLLNLLSNGVKYNRENGALWIEVRSEGTEVAIFVDDEGKGLTPQQHAQLFQPFDRLGVESSGVPGSGLGLVISRQLVEAMHGRLEVRDRVEGGCRFEVWLPAHAAPLLTRPAPLHDAAAPDRAAAEATAVDLPLVLCVEDNPVNALLLREVIGIIGRCRLLLAEDGEQGLALAMRHRPALLVSDINLPGMDGLALVKAIRADPALRTMRCIALSGDALSESRERALLAGFDDYWTKPLDFGLLGREILGLGIGAGVDA